MFKILLSSTEKTWEVESTPSQYFFSYLYRFDCKYDLGIFLNGIATLRDENLKNFVLYFEESLTELLQDCYTAPDMEKVGNRRTSSLYERFIFNKKIHRQLYIFPNRPAYLWNILVVSLLIVFI